MSPVRSQGPRARARRHDWADERSRALHAAVAEKLCHDPRLVRVALDNLARWEQTDDPRARRALAEWRRLLTSAPIEQVIRLLTEESEQADAMRQNAPFAGVLSPEERSAIFASYERL